MKKARNFWRDLPQGGSRYGSVLTRLFLLVCMLTTASSGWAQTTFTYTGSSGYDTNGTTHNNITVTFSNGSHSNSNGGYWGVSAQNATLTVTSTSANITNIEINYNGANYAKDDLEIKTGSGTYALSSTTGTYTTSTPEQNVVLKFKTSGARISTVVVTTSGSGGSTTIAAPTFTYDSTVRADHASIAGAHTGDIVTINAATGKYIYADWSSSTSQTKDYVFTDGKSRAQTTYQATISACGTRVIYAVAGVNNDGTGASSDLTYIQFTGVTPQNPTFSVAEGSVAKNTSLTLTKGYSEDKIYYTYTTDGSEPANPTSSSSEYTSALNLFTADGTTYKIKAIAYDKTGDYTSTVVTKTYTTPAAATAYAVTQASTTNGSFTVTPASATEGTAITVTTSPASGYEVDAVTLSTGGSVTKAAENSYTFSMPASAVEVTVTFKETSTPSAGQTWDFTTTNATDNTNLAADATNWTANSGTYTYKNQITQGQANMIELQANGSDLILLDGLKFGRASSGNLNANKIKYTPGSYIYFDGQSSFLVPNLTTGQTVTVTWKSNNNSARTVTTSNNLKNASGSGPSASQASATYNVTQNGDGLFTISDKYYLYKIEVGSSTQYTIYKDDATNGSFVTKVNNSEVDAAAEGATVTVTATPKSGYEVDAVTISPSRTVTKVSNNNYTFTMPGEDVTVTTTFKAIVKQDVTLAWATSGDKTLTVGETYNNAATATAAEDGVLGSGVTYTSDNTSVATVSPTGVVTAVATGTAIITAKFAATDYYNAATDITYTVTVEAAVVASGKTWDFTTMSTADQTAYQNATPYWSHSSSAFFSNLFEAEKNTASDYSGTGITQIEGLKYIRTGSSLSTNNIQIYKPTNSAEGYLKTAGGAGRGIVIPASELETGVTVSVEFDGTNAAYGFNLSNAKASDSDADVSSILSAERTIKTFRVKNGSENVNLIANSTNVKLYKITIGSAVTVKAPTITLAEPATYSSSDNTKSTTFTTNETETGAATYYIVGESAETNAATVVSTGTQATSGSATDINLSSFASDESDVIVSAVTTFTKNGKAYYSPIVTATYTYDGVRSFLVDAADKTIQAGYRDNVDPYITYKDGTRFEIGEDDSHTLSDYFTFTYASSGDAGITVDNYGVITVPDNATAGDKATITITAQPTPALGEPRFGSTSKTGTMTVTVKEKNTTLKMSFYWDPECKKEVTGPGDSSDWKYGTEANNEKERSVFNANIQNGRMIYVKPADGYEVWVATKTSPTANDATVKTPTASRGTSSSDNFNTVHGIPLYISGGSGTLVIGLKSFISATGVEDGYTVSARFNIVNTNPEKRPAGPSFDPTQEAVPTPNTSQTIAAVGDDETSEVFSKFGSKTMSLGQFINYTAGTQYSKGTVATFSTEVGTRHIQAVQVVGSEKEWYISDFVTTTKDYDYKLAGKLLVSPTVYYANVKEAFDAPVLTKITTDQAEEPQASDYTTPTLTGYFFNKQKSEAGSAPYQGLTFGGDNNPYLSYSIESHEGAEATINATTGAVTIGSKSGYAIVTVNYAGGESYTIKTKAVGEKNVKTSPATITYRINILDPTEHVPTISPASKNFANSQEVKVTADDWDAYYTIDGTEPTASNGTLVKAGETATFTVGETAAIGTEITVKAIAYDPDSKEYGKLVDETYTKVTPLHLPVLAPYGTEDSPYTFTSATQAITAYAQDAGADVYFTTDGTDPRDGKGLKYDGSSKIVITGTATVKAAAYKDGIYSDVVTGYYVHTDDLVAPWFLKGDTKITGTSETVTLSDVIKISNGREAQGSVYYYTLDGSNPTATTGQKYTAGFNIYKTTTAKVIAVENGLVSPITTVNFTVENESSQHNYWEANTTTTNKGKITNDDRKVSLAAHNASSRTATIYVENLTATFGGFDNKDWNHASIGEDKQGAALDGVGEFSVRNTDDADDENDEEFTPANFKIATVHGRTHKLPSKGAYVKFEPEYDGTITVWALQQGGLHYNNSGDFCNRFIRLRPVFIVDEQGNSIEATSVESTARLSDNWNKLDNTNWLPKNEGKQNGEMNLFYDGTQNTAIYNMYSNKLGEMTDEDNRIAPFEITEDVYDAVYGNDDYTGIHGYAMPSGGNVKYTFPVKAGKTYFFFGHRTKLCIRGFNFVPTTTDLGETVTLPQNADATTFISTTYKDKTKNVKLERSVTADKWTTFCLPFSVSQTQLENTFGAGTQVMQFVNVEGYTMNVFKHYHHMIVAGTPIMVRPANTLQSVTFNGVHIEENVTPEEICDSEDDTYKFVGGYTPMEIKNGSYYIGNKDGLWHKLNNTTSGKSTLNGSRAYLKLKEGSNARALTLNIASFDGEEDYTTTGIANIESDGIDLDGVNDSTNKFDDNIYNVQGQLVRKHAKNLNGLAKGVYIINGKKVVIND